MEPECTAGGLVASLTGCHDGPCGRRSNNEEEVEMEGYSLLSLSPPGTAWFLDFITANFTECSEVLTTFVQQGG